MKVYKIKSDFGNYYSFSIDNGELFSKMPSYTAKFKGKSRISEWVPPNTEFYKSDNYAGNGVHIPDITVWASGNLALNKKAYEILAPVMKEYGEFLEAYCEGVAYYIFNTLTVIPDEYIDEDKTSADDESGVYMGLTSLGFKAFRPDEFMLFKTTADKYANTYCTDAFAAHVKDADLKGLIFSSDLCGYN
jgi:hypothetical protein